MFTGRKGTRQNSRNVYFILKMFSVTPLVVPDRDGSQYFLYQSPYRRKSSGNSPLNFSKQSDITAKDDGGQADK